MLWNRGNIGQNGRIAKAEFKPWARWVGGHGRPHPPVPHACVRGDRPSGRRGEIRSAARFGNRAEQTWSRCSSSAAKRSGVNPETRGLLGRSTHTRLDDVPASGTVVNGPAMRWNSVEISACGRHAGMRARRSEDRTSAMCDASVRANSRSAAIRGGDEGCAEGLAVRQRHHRRGFLAVQRRH